MGKSGIAGARVQKLAGAALCALALVPLAAHADVLEIAGDGAVIVHAGPEIVTGADRKAIPGNALSHATPERERHVSRRAIASPAVGEAIASASSHYAVSPSLIAAVARQESGFEPSAISPKGARGVMQLMPATLSEWCPGPCSAADNVSAGTAYLKQLLARYHGDIALALAAYNAGPAAVDRFGGIPPYRETTAYVDSIFANLSASALAGTN